MRPEGRVFKPWPAHFVAFLGKRHKSHSSRGSENTPSRFILQKPEISAGSDEPSGLPNFDGEDLYLNVVLSIILYRFPFKYGISEYSRSLILNHPKYPESG